MNEGKIRVVIDTNLWISMAMGSIKVSAQMLEVIGNQDIEIFASVELLDELTTTLAKPKLQKYLDQSRTRNLFDLLWTRANLVKIESNECFCRDPKDDFVINLALDSKANYILSGDQDLLILHPLRDLSILTITDFLSEP